MPNLEILRADYDAALERKADVDARYSLAKAILDEQVAAIESGWAMSNAELFGEWHHAAGEAKEAETSLRTAVVQTWNVSDKSSKTVDKELGLSVKAPDKVKITDEKAALGWLEKHFPVAIERTISRKVFDAWALALPASDRPDFVEITQDAVAVIGKLK